MFDFKNNKSNGHGTYTFADDSIYDGEWQDNKQHGHGKFTLADGRENIVEYRDGCLWNGVFFPDGHIEEWENGVKKEAIQ
jgi:hypothetical protein